MKASIGRIVLVLGGPVISNGTNLAPAIITRAWSDRDTRDDDPDAKPILINVTSFPDLIGSQHLGSIPLFDTKAQAESAYNEQSGQAVAYWPPRE